MHDHFNKSYSRMPKYNILLVLFTLVCLVLPSHFDWLLHIGYIDDAVSNILSR